MTTEKPKKTEPYLFKDDEKIVLRYLVDEIKKVESHPAVIQLQHLQGQLNTYMSSISKDNHHAKELLFMDNVNLTGVYATAEEADEAGKTK